MFDTRTALLNSQKRDFTADERKQLAKKGKAMRKSGDKATQKMDGFERVQKFNENHDANGRFAEASADSYEKAGMPLKGHEYHGKSEDSLRFIHKDASEAAQNMHQMHPDTISPKESKYLDQANDAATVLGYRQRNDLTGRVAGDVPVQVSGHNYFARQSNAPADLLHAHPSGVYRLHDPHGNYFMNATGDQVKGMGGKLKSVGEKFGETFPDGKIWGKKSEFPLDPLQSNPATTITTEEDPTVDKLKMPQPYLSALRPRNLDKLKEPKPYLQVQDPQVASIFQALGSKVNS
jgi:hypothetical protein